MQRISLIILVILIEYCVAHTECGRTGKPCKSKGGICQPRDIDCAGKVWSGKKFCKKWRNCNCCANCSAGIQKSCKILNGVCMKREDVCNGTEVLNNMFCSHRDTCKCCIPLMSEYDCCFALSPPGFWIETGTQNATNCYEHNAVPTGIGNQLGAQCCWRRDCPINCEVVYENQLYEGKCRNDDCLKMETRVDFCPGSNCNCCINKTEVCVVEKCSYQEKYKGDCLREQPTNTIEVGQQECKDGCNCYVNDTICGPVCTSLLPSCTCSNGTCPEGYCVYEKYSIFCKGCSCCQMSNCTSKHNECTGPGDFCVEKHDFLPLRLCPKGHATVSNTCYRNATTFDRPTNATSVECDCCKSLACRPIDGRCSRRGAYCIDRLAICPPGFQTSDDCSKPVVVNGVWVASKLCKCCTPLVIG